MSAVRLCIVCIEEAVDSLIILIGDDSVDVDVFDAAEDILLHLRIYLLELGDKIFYLKAF